MVISHLRTYVISHDAHRGWWPPIYQRPFTDDDFVAQYVCGVWVFLKGKELVKSSKMDEYL